ncbi:MAG: acylphosphatase [Oscillospiraceae bacterium]|nr:acylphosphatase [Oscillospiraceae bacterium]
MDLIRKRYILSGLVQGVGFRWRARQAAQAEGLTGWVRNRMDGSVAMELQGSREQIERTMDLIRRGRWIRIEEVWERQIPPDPEERSFAVLDDAW